MLSTLDVPSDTDFTKAFDWVTLDDARLHHVLNPGEYLAHHSLVTVTSQVIIRRPGVTRAIQWCIKSLFRIHDLLPHVHF